MFCHICGQKNDEESNFCTSCGTKLAKIAIEDSNAVLEDKNINDDIIEAVEIVDRGNNATEIKLESINSDVKEYEFQYQEGEIAYAECRSVDDNGVAAFTCIDNVSQFYLNKKCIEAFGVNPKKGVKIWVYLSTKNKKTDKYYVGTVKKSHYLEQKNFVKFHKVKDIIYAPVTKVDKDFIVVNIGPTAQVKIYANDIPSYLNVRENKYYRFAVSNIQGKEKDKKYKIDLAFAEDRFSQQKKLWNELPERIYDKRKVLIPEKMLTILQENTDVCNKLFEGHEVSMQSFKQILEKRYQEAYEKKQINIQVTSATNGKVLYMDFDLGVRDKKGVPQSAGFKKKEGDLWVCNLIGFTSAECMFERYVFINDWKQLLDELSEMALGDEDWDYQRGGRSDKYILRQYLLFGFYKSWLDNLVVIENEEALFNTGLVDSSYDEIYCYLKKNTNKNDFYERPWEFACFAARGKGANGKKINHSFADFPSAPSYVDVNRISDLFFDPEKELYCDYEHIIQDNLKRLPATFLKSKLCYDSEMERAISAFERSKSSADWARITRLVNEKSERGERFRRDLQNGLKDAVDTAKKYCKWNYKTAIPIYYPRNNGISLLLPLKLQTNPNSLVDVALVVECLQNGNYQGQTILTLEMAYQDARQICRPNSEWLTINNIVETGEGDFDEDEASIS